MDGAHRWRTSSGYDGNCDVVQLCLMANVKSELIEDIDNDVVICYKYACVDFIYNYAHTRINSASYLLQ